MIKALSHLDEEIFLYFNQMGSAKWDGFWVILTNYYYAFPLYLLLGLLILWKFGFKKTFFSLGTLVLGLAALWVVSRLSKYGFARPRPCNVDLSGLTQVRYPLREDCGDFGFFSAHASLAMMLVYFTGTMLKKYYRYIFWFLGLWLLLFSFSRIYVGKHYPGDLIVGIAAGWIFGFVFYRIWLLIQARLNRSETL